jgi:hypothetical protein
MVRRVALATRLGPLKVALFFVMAGPVPAIHVFLGAMVLYCLDMDARHKAGHDEL